MERLDGRWLGYQVLGLFTVVTDVFLALNKKLKSRSHCLSSPIVGTTIIMLAGESQTYFRSSLPSRSDDRKYVCGSQARCYLTTWAKHPKHTRDVHKIKLCDGQNLVPRSPRSCAGLRKWRVTRHASAESTEDHWQETFSEAQGKLTKNYFFSAFRLVVNNPNHSSLSLILGFGVTVAIWPREAVSCRDFILPSVATFWVMSLVGIYPGRASYMAVNRLRFSKH